MTEPDELPPTADPAAVVLRAIYDEAGRLNSIVTEFRQAPQAEAIARVLAQFMMPQPSTLPQRAPGEALRAVRRDPILARRFEEVIKDGCLVTANILDPVDTHDNHICTHVADHDGQHLCDCGLYFGG